MILMLLACGSVKSVIATIGENGMSRQVRTHQTPFQRCALPACKVIYYFPNLHLLLFSYFVKSFVAQPALAAK